ncbi:flagellar transcriptional regulator FlhD, partial [Escherichia coli]|nr:flagellar transcriptional regulator FlhD [Escherichia coli]
DRNRSHWSTSKTPSYTKSVSWQHHQASAMFRLGINEEMATTLAALTLPQMVKLAETNQLVCHFRFDSHQTITQLTQDSRVDDLQQIHTGIMLSTRLLNDVNQPEEALRKKRA